MLERGVDFSEGADLSPATCQAWKNDGVKNLYIQYSSKLAHYLDRSDGYGFNRDVYVYLYFPLSPWNQTPESRVQTAMGIAAGHDVRRIWLDVEEPTDTATHAECVAALQRCVKLVEDAGYEAGIYTGKDTWRVHTGNSTAFKHLALWNADYRHGDPPPPQPDMDDEPEELAFPHGAYGGWKLPTVWQWHGTTMFHGHSVDMNVEEAGDDAGEGTDDDMKFVLPRPGVATWWDDRFVVRTPRDEERYYLDAVKDFGAEPGDLVRFQIRLHNGRLRFYHGGTDLIAGEIFGTGSTAIEAKVGDDGRIQVVAEVDTHVDEMFALGYYR